MGVVPGATHPRLLPPSLLAAPALLPPSCPPHHWRGRTVANFGSKFGNPCDYQCSDSWGNKLISCRREFHRLGAVTEKDLYRAAAI